MFDPGKQPKTFANADPFDADHNYVKDSIRKPQLHIRAGYEGVNMSAYPPSIVSDKEIDAIIAYMELLAGVYDGPTKEEAEAAAKKAEAEAAGMGEKTDTIESATDDTTDSTGDSENPAPEAGE